MKIFAASLSSTGSDIKTVTLNRAKNKLSLIKARVIDQKAFASAKGNVFITGEYLDLVSATVELPPVKDEVSVNLVIKNKLIDSLRPDQEYSFIRREIQTEGQRVNLMSKTYNVYGVPNEFVTSIVPPKVMHNVLLLTLDQFALINISKRVSPNELVCHVFADTERVIVSFSMGDQLVYSRVTVIPENISQGGNINEFIYDTINLTYVYARQSKQLAVSVFIMSGLLFNQQEIISKVRSLTGLSITTLSAKPFIKNCTDEVFNTYLLPIAAAMSDSSIDFLPVYNKQLQAFKFVIKVVNFALVAVFFVALYILNGKYAEYKEVSFRLQNSVNQLNAKLDALDSKLGNDTKRSLLHYCNKYIAGLQRRDESAVMLIPSVQDMIYRDIYDSITFISSEYNVVEVGKGLNFDNYTTTFVFAEDYDKFLQSMEEKGFLVNAGSVIALPDRSFEIMADLQDTDVDLEVE